MEREILFRGKESDSGKWIYGYLWSKRTIGVTSSIGNVDEVVVDSDTIGQYAGLTDKKGKKIFEGDIISFGNSKIPLLVEFINFSWVCTSEKMFPYYILKLDEDGKNYEVIGNVNDNPELMEGNKNE